MQNQIPTDRADGKNHFHGKLVLTAGFLTLMILYGTQYSFGVFLKPLSADFGWTRAETAAAYSLNHIVYASIAIFAGRLSDRFKPAPVLLALGILITIGIFLMSQCSALWQLYLVFGVIFSIGMGATYITILSTIAKWFVGRMGAPTGILLTGIGAGIIVMPPFASMLISSFGWRMAFIVIACITMLIPLVFVHFFRHGPAHVNSPANGDEKSATGNLLKQGYTVRQALGTRQLWLICVTYFCSSACLGTMMVHIVAYATDAGIEPNLAATILSVIGIVSIISKLGTGLSLDRIRSRSILITLAIVTALAFLVLQLPAQLWILYLAAALFAVGYGGWATAQSPTIAEYFGLKAHGALLGVTLIGVGIGSAFGPYVAGLVFDSLKSYSPAFWGCFTLCLIAFTLPLFLKPTAEKTGG